MTIWDPNWVIATFTVVLVIVTALYAVFTYKILKATQRQANIQADALAVQNRFLHAQILSQRFEMYWKSYEPISELELSEVALVPDDWMDPKKFEEKYKNDKTALRRYIYLSRCYEYLAFANTMKKLEIPDPLGYSWTELWAKDLTQHEEFLEVNDWYRSYYPEFSTLVDAFGKSTRATQ